jgi:NAD(P)-dependent dehydrogenase (short-subunit alcohol dehydrogenase family)
MRINGSVAVVTGASSGIGRATALALSQRGASVVLAARRPEALEEVAAECQALGAETLVVPTDVSDPAQVERLAERAMSRFGRIDAWVNNAAVTMFAPFLEAPLDDVERIWRVNVMGYWHGLRAALPRMKDRGNGVVVNVSSVVSGLPQPYTQIYSMTKAANRAMGASVRQELMLEGSRSRGVKVVSVLPAAIDTPLFEHNANFTGRETKAMPPVYSAERVARTIVNQIRFPRREVTVGPAGRQMLMQAKFSPRLTERFMAGQVDKTHLARTKPAAATHGNLFEPAEGAGSVDGGWGGRRKTAVRRVVAATVAITVMSVLFTRIRRSH